VGGPTWADLDPVYVDVEWERTVLHLTERVPDGVLVVLVPDDRPARVAGTGERPTVIEASTTDLLAWLTGRAPGADDRPMLGPWR
jgi:maleylpyruvate isomerase